MSGFVFVSSTYILLTCDTCNIAHQLRVSLHLYSTHIATAHRAEQYRVYTLLGHRRPSLIYVIALERESFLRQIFV